MPSFDIGIRCHMEAGQWIVEDVLPHMPEDHPEMVSMVGVYQDVLATAIKYLAVKYLIKLPQNLSYEHSSPYVEESLDDHQRRLNNSG